MNHCQLEVGEPGREEHTYRSFGNDDNGDDRLVLKPLERSDKRDQKNVDVEKKTPGRDWKPEETGPLACVDRMLVEYVIYSSLELLIGILNRSYDIL